MSSQACSDCISGFEYIPELFQSYSTNGAGLLLKIHLSAQLTSFLLFHLGPCVGKVLVPYFRQFLPILNVFANRNANFSDRIDYNRVGRLSDIIDDTLMTLERCGGENAYINIKYAIPTYESCVNN